MERATQERLVGATLLIVAGVIMIPWLLDGKTEPALAERELVLPGSSDNGNETRRIALDLPGQGPRSGAQAVRELDSRSVRDVDEMAAMNLPKPDPQAAPERAPSDEARPLTGATDARPADVPDRAAEVPARFKSPMPESKPTPQAVQPAPAPVTKPPVSSAPAAQVARVPEDPPAAAKPAPRASSSSTSAPSTGRQGWAVQVGSFANKDNAERLSELLRGKSYNAFVMPSETNGRVLYRVRVGPVSERNEAELLAGALREDRQPARVLTHP